MKILFTKLHIVSQAHLDRIEAAVTEQRNSDNRLICNLLNRNAELMHRFIRAPRIIHKYIEVTSPLHKLKQKSFQKMVKGNK